MKTYSSGLLATVCLKKTMFNDQFPAGKARLCPGADPRRHVFRAGLRVAGHGNGAGSPGRRPAAAWDFGVVAGEAWGGRPAGGERFGHQAEAGHGGGMMGRIRYQPRYQTYDGEIPIISHTYPKHIPNIPKHVVARYLNHIHIPGSTFSPGPSCYQLPHFAVALGRSQPGARGCRPWGEPCSQWLDSCWRVCEYVKIY